MNILYIANSRIPTEKANGNAIMKQCSAFVRNGVNLELWVPNRVNPISDDPFAYYNITTVFPLKYLWTLDIRLLEKIKMRFPLQLLTFVCRVLVKMFFDTKKYDYIYTRDIWIAWWCSLFGYPTVFEAHSMHGINRISGHAMRRCHKIVSITHGLADDLSEQFKLDRQSILVSPSGVDASEFQQHITHKKAREKFAINDPRPIALYIGLLDKWKGVETFFESAGLLPDIHCVAIGGPDKEREKYQKQYPAVTFLGQKPQRALADNQQLADVLVVPNTAKMDISAKYTSPMKIVAHMFSGIPMVVSDLSSTRELVDDTTAWLVEADNPQKLAEQIQVAILSSSSSNVKTDNARVQANKYDWNVRAQIILEHL